MSPAYWFILRRRAQSVPQADEDRNEGRQVPVLYRARDGMTRRIDLIEVTNQGDRIAILFRLRGMFFGFATGLAEAGIEVETDTID